MTIYNDTINNKTINGNESSANNNITGSNNTINTNITSNTSSQTGSDDDIIIENDDILDNDDGFNNIPTNPDTPVKESIFDNNVNLIIGGAILLVIIIAVIYMCIKCRKKTKVQAPVTPPIPIDQND